MAHRNRRGEQISSSKYFLSVSIYLSKTDLAIYFKVIVSHINIRYVSEMYSLLAKEKKMLCHGCAEINTC